MAGTVVVLGAGATRGAEFKSWIDGANAHTGRHVGAPAPALDADFFDKLLHVSGGNPEHDVLIQRVISDARWVAVGSGYPTLERMFTYVEAANRKAIGIANINGCPPVEVRGRLVRAIALQLGSALCKQGQTDGNDAHHRCYHHFWLAGSTDSRSPNLDADDTIISFNYDCLMDFALSRACKAWTASTGYTLDRPFGWEKWTAGGGVGAPISSLRLLKLHGSLNWQRMPHCHFGLSDHNYVDVVDPVVIPPEWRKDGLETEPFLRIWNEASAAIRTAKSIVVIGCSVPITDLEAQVFVRAARDSAETGLDRLVIVNPDEEAQRRARQVFLGRHDHDTRVIRAKDWEEFRTLDIRLWHRQQAF